MDTRIPGEKGFDPSDRVGMGLGRGRLVQLDGGSLGPVETGHQQAGAHQLGEWFSGVARRGRSGVGGGGHGLTLRVDR